VLDIPSGGSVLKIRIFRAFIVVSVFALVALLAACASGNAGRIGARLAPEVQAQLNALQTPKGVDPAVFAQLKNELVRQLTARDKTSSGAPSGVENTPANVHFTDNGGGSFTLEWDYRNIGDYNQDGVVNVADITPLAVHFGHDPGTDGLDIVLHPSGVGKVGVGDITPLAQHFGAYFTGYSIRSDVSETGFFTTVVGAMLRTEATGGTDGWKHYSYTFDADPVLWYRVQSWDEHGGQGEPSAALQTGVIGDAPVINGVTPLTGGANEEITFSADVTGTVIDWSWDFGGGTNPNTSTLASPVMDLTGPGTYDAYVTATNPFGSDTYNFTLIVTDKWYVHKMLDGPGYGRAVSAAFVGSSVGKASVAFSNDNDNSIMYARSTATWYPTSASDWVYMTADDTNDYTGNISLATMNGLEPGILAFTGDKAEFIAASSPEPSSGADWAASDITTGLTGNTGSLNLLQGQLTATLHYSDALYYFEASTQYPAGPADWAPLIVDASGVVDLGADAVTVQNPMNSNVYTLYRDSTSEKLKLVWVDFYNRYAPLLWTKLEIASGGAPGIWSGMAFDRVGSMMAFYTQKNPGDMIYWTYGIDTPALPADVALNGQVSVDPTVFDAYEGLAAGFVEGQRWLSTMRANDKSYLGIHSIPFAPATPPVSATFQVIDQPGAPTTISGGNAMIVDSGAFVVVFYGRSDGMFCAVLPLR
jgi:PKD repeat protein